MSSISAPLKITLYDPETDEVKAEYTCTIIRSRFLKKALALQHLQGQTEISDEDADAIAALICQVFKNKFTIDEFWDLSSLEEAWPILDSIIARASRLWGNPPPQGN